MHSSEQPDVSITIVSWNTRELLRACLDSLLASVDCQIEIHVVDNASEDGSGEMVRSGYSNVRLTQNVSNFGFARANNQSWHTVRGRYWMLLNSDTLVKPLSLATLVKFLDENPKVALATPRLVGTDGLPQHCAHAAPGVLRVLLDTFRVHKIFPSAFQEFLPLRSEFAHDRTRAVGWTWGTALVARRCAVEAVGLLSEDFFMYGEDVEWCLRMQKKGWEVWYCAEAEVLHYGAQSSLSTWSDKQRMQRINDGYYNALSKYHTMIWVRALQTARLVQTLTELLLNSFRRRPVDHEISSIRYHLNLLFGTL
jgi:N-acetylglucosaminyl-diphospho-decaprenol L-rhamnosyltransferase